MNVKEELIHKIMNKSAIVGVVGLGYVGLPFAVEKGKVGYHVIGIDQNPVKAEKINAGENYILGVKDEELRDLVEEGLSDFTRPEMDIVSICVPTPLT